MKQDLTQQQLARFLANELHKNETQAEKLLWQKLRRKQSLGLKFIRQHPIFDKSFNHLKFFIADFYCHKLKLIIELDGKIHLRQKDYDNAREEIIISKGITIIRFENELIDKNLNKVIIQLKRRVDRILSK